MIREFELSVPTSTPDLQGGEEGLEVELTTNGELFNQSYLLNEVFIIIPQISSWEEVFQVGEHLEVLGGWCA